MKQRQSMGGVGLLILMLLVIMFFSLKVPGMATERELSYPEFMVYLENKTVESAQIRPNREVPTGEVIFETTSGDREEFNVLDVKEVEMALRKAGVPYTTTSVRQDSYFMTVILPIALSAGVLIFLFMFINSRSGGGANAKMMNFGRSRARMVSTSKVNFTKVAGLEEEKEELEEIVDFLKNPQKYTGVGARIPKGVILVGPPGTGKTLLAKAVAGEAGVPFFSISGSDFVEMFVGVGASRVRDLFEEAKKNAPCIVFIDEIDAVARQRGTGMGGGHDEREQTLNQLLVEMDGFGVNEGIIVMAATNRVDILDPAILRPGRFDRKVAVGRPDVKGREEILGVHTKEKPLGEDVDLHRIAQTTAGFTGADLENLMNEAAINTAKEGRKFLTQTDIEKAFIKVGIGAETSSRSWSRKCRRTWCIGALTTVLAMVLYLWSNSQAVYVHRGAVTDVSIAQEFAAQPLFFLRFLLKAVASSVIGVAQIQELEAGSPWFVRLHLVYLLGLAVFVSYLLALYLNVRFQLYKKTIFPLLLVLSGGCNHLLVLAARWIFLKDEYGMSSRYEIQYQMGIVGILLTFALVWSMCREKAQETEADKAKTRAPEKRAARTPLKVCMLAFTVLTVFGNAWTTRAEIRTAPYRKAYLQVSRELGRNYRTASDEDLETYLHNDPDAVREAMRILEENHLNIFR